MSHAAPQVEIVDSQLALPAHPDQAIVSGRPAGRSFVAWLPLALAVLFFIATRWWALAVFQPFQCDINYYREVARQGIDCGRIPYRDFVIEYPPVAYWVMTVPRLIDAQTHAGNGAKGEVIRAFCADYDRWFHAEMFLADLICFCLLLVIGARLLAGAAWVLPAAYAGLTIAQPHLIYERLDLGLLVFILLSVACWLRSLDPSARFRAWAWCAYLFLGLGISFKLVPVIMVPFFVLADFWAPGLGRQLVGRIAILLVAAAGPFLCHVPTAGTDVLSLFRYHSDRGIHIESAWGSILLAAARFGMPCQIKTEYGAYDVLSDWTATLKFGSMLALPAVIGLLLLWAVLNRRRFSRHVAVNAAMLAVVDSAAVAHVFSPQYLNWILPLVLVLGLSVLPRRWAPWCLVAGLSLAVLGITTWLWPAHYRGFVKGSDLVAAWLAIGRSACLTALAVILSGYVLLRIRTVGPVDPRPISEQISIHPAGISRRKKRRGWPATFAGTN